MTTTRSRESAVKFLEQSPLFAQLGDSARHALAAQALPRSFSPGEPICRLGDPGLSMMAVVVGVVRISLPTVRGKELILADLPAGELFGEIAMLDGKPRSANATALTACDLLVLERRNAIPFLEANPAVCLRLMEILCARIRRSDERMADIAFFDLPTRLAKILPIQPAKARSPARLSLSQTELAEMAGGTRENVNRCLRNWERQGIVKLKGGWTTILKPEILRRLVASLE